MLAVGGGLSIGFRIVRRFLFLHATLVLQLSSIAIPPTAFNRVILVPDRFKKKWE
jgi:hypothetical protein